MLSIYTLKSASEAARYYASGDYYSSNPPEQSAWFGEGAKRLGLEGMVDQQVFEKLLQGYLPNGVVMSQTQHGQHHRPGYDLTFSAPKSVSILALVAGNQGVLEAHRQAIEETLIRLEQKYAGVRNKNQGVTTTEKTGNFLWARFEEYDSRAGDPQLHDHCVLLNMTQKTDGSFRTLYFDEVYWDKMVNGLEYRARLGQKLMALGYVLDFRAGGLFEIKGVPEGLIEQLSKRRAEIKGWLKEHEASGGLASQLANFQTRQSKKPEDLKVRQERWLQALASLKIALETLTILEKEAKARGPVQLPDPSFFASEALNLAIQHCAEKYPEVSIRTLIKMACRFSMVPIRESDCVPLVEEHIKDKTLLYVGQGFVRSAASIEQAQKLIQSLQSQRVVQPILTPWVADFILKLKVKSPAQRGALKGFLTSHAPQLCLESSSRRALKEVFASFNRLCEAQHFYPCFLSNRLSELESFKQGLQSPRVLSLEGFLLGCEAKIAAQNPKPGRLEQWTARIKAKQAPEIWVVVSELSLSQWLRLQQAALALHARLILNQDSRYPSWLQAFKDKGLPSITLEVPKTHEEVLKAQELVVKHLERLKDELFEIKEPAAQIQKALDLSLQGSKPLLTLSTHDREAASRAVRTLLKEQGALGAGLKMLSLEPLALSQAQKSMLSAYQPGDVLRFAASRQGRCFKGRYERVALVDLNQGLVRFESGTHWSPKDSTIPLKRIEVFRGVFSELCVGERLQWTRTVRHESDKSLDRVAYQQARVTAIEERTQTITVRLENGQSLSFKADDGGNSHWAYCYALLLKQADLEIPKASILLLKAQAIDAKTIVQLEQVFSQAQACRVPLQVIAEDREALKQALLNPGLVQEPAHTKGEVPYQRHEALHQDQTLPTQVLCAGLQAEYLKVRELNPEFLPQNIGKGPDSSLNIDVNVKEASRLVDWVCLYHAERDAVFSRSQACKEALQLAEGRLSSEPLEQAFELAFQRGWLIKVGENEALEPLIACRHTVLLEKLCIEQMRQGQGQLQPLFASDAPAIQAIQADARLTQGQKAAIELLLTSSDRACAVQGIAGAGKTTALKAIQGCCVAQGFEPLVLADTGNAKNQAEQVSGMVAMTLAQFLTSVETLLAEHPEQAQKDYGKHQLMILDEASMASTRNMFRLQKVTTLLNVHLGFTGDFKQQGSLGAGLQFEDLLGYGIRKAVMKENVRLKSPQAFAALQKAYAGDVSGTLEVLRDRIEAIPVKAEALGRMVELYVGFIEKHQAPPLVITPLNKDRHFVNQGIRAALKVKGHLGADVLETTVLLPADRREIEKQSIRGFEVDGVIRFNTAQPRLGIQAGSYWRVQAIDEKHHRLTLQPFIKDVTDPERCVYWAPKDLAKPSGIELYKVGSRSLALGDWMIFKRNQPTLGIFNGDKAQVLGLEEDQLEVRLANQSIVKLALAEPSCRHWDYGYALTVYQSQGRDVPFVIAYGDALKPIPCLGAHLRKGHWIVLPKTPKGVPTGTSLENLPARPLSQVVRILSIHEQTMRVRDGQGHCYEIAFDPKQRWESFPLFSKRSRHDWPKSTSLNAFLVQISRGDWVHVIVPHLEDFKALLEANANPKASALSKLDPSWAERNQAVQRLVSAIQWQHAPQVQAAMHPEVQKPLSKKSPSQRIEKAFIDKEALVARLASNALDYAIQWLGEPKKIIASDARWKGGLSVTITGEHAGRWRHWAAGQGGKDLISLYAHAYQVEWKSALKTLAQDLGVDQSKAFLSPEKNPTLKKEGQTLDATKTDTCQKAQALYQQGVPIQGTVAETYLRKARGIQGTLPEDFRFIKATWHFETRENRPALLAPVWGEDHHLKAITRIFLNPDGSKYEGRYKDRQGKLQKANPRLSLGSMGKAGIVVQEGLNPRTLWLAEGLETALSVAQALPHQYVVATTSAERLKSIAPQAGVERVVICADQDGPQAQSYQSVLKAAEQYLKQGLRVFIAMPKPLEGFEKVDFNDVLKHSGVSEVQKILEQKVEMKSLESLNQAKMDLPKALANSRQPKVEAIHREVQIQREVAPKDLEQDR